jgi:DNA-binding NtrC family response regulator
LAHGGTIFLDEIGEVSPPTQILLLRVLQDHRFERVGGEETLEVDVRVIAATNKNLMEEMKKGTFREDLYYRLSIVPITVPPLRERVSDIPLLVSHFLKQFQGEKRSIRIEPEVVEHLKSCHWSGNIRELANVIQQMIVLCRRDTITMNDLPPLLLSAEEESSGEKMGNVSLTRMISDLERRWILSKLRESDWNQEKTAELLGITRKMLMSRMRKYNIKTPKNKLSLA